MSSFQNRVQKLQCEEVNHDNKPIILICFNKDCQKRKVCLTCIEEFHTNHKGELASIEDVESFIRKNCIKQRRAFQCNDILGKFDELKNDILNQLKVLEFILKEKVQFQQVGDECENDLNDLQNKCKQQIEEVKSEWNNKINSFKSILTPIQINLKRFEKLSEKDIDLNAQQVNISHKSNQFILNTLLLLHVLAAKDKFKHKLTMKLELVHMQLAAFGCCWSLFWMLFDSIFCQRLQRCSSLLPCMLSQYWQKEILI